MSLYLLFAQWLAACTTPKNPEEPAEALVAPLPESDPPTPPNSCQVMWDNDVYLNANQGSVEKEIILKPDLKNNKETYFAACEANMSKIDSSASPMWSPARIEELARYAKTHGRNVVAVGPAFKGKHGSRQYLDIDSNYFYIGLSALFPKSLIKMEKKEWTGLFKYFEDSDDQALKKEYIDPIPDTLGYETFPSSKFRAVQNPNLKNLLQSVLKDNSKPQIVTFGETHPSGNDYGINAATLFAKTILPEMKNQDYNDLVFEFLPEDVSQEELNALWVDGKLNSKGAPLLIKYLENFSVNVMYAILDILKSAHKLGMTVHGASPSYQWFHDTLTSKNTSKEAREAALDERVLIIRDTSAKVIESLAKEGKKVMSYGGTNHNNVSGKPKSSFGKSLARRYTYAEIDFIIPHSLYVTIREGFGGTMPQPDIIYPLKIYDRFIPPSGTISLVTRQKGSYAFVYPLE